MLYWMVAVLPAVLALPVRDFHELNPPGLFEGDIVMPRDRSAIPYEARRWCGGVMPYVIDGAFSAENRTVFQDVFDEFSAIGITIRPKTSSDFDYVNFIVNTNGDVCGLSYVGKITGMQYITIGMNCITMRTIGHEIMHALGFYHEQNRPDRDSYVTIHWENINPDYRYAYNKRSTSLTSGTPYDPYSIMHYHVKAFASSGTVAMTFKDPSVNVSLVGGYELSDMDKQEIQAIYSDVDPVVACSTPTTRSPPRSTAGYDNGTPSASQDSSSTSL